MSPTKRSDSARLTWSYDATYRLTREERNGTGTTVTWDIAYVYDPASNRLVQRERLRASAAEVRTTSSYDVASQLPRTLAGGSYGTARQFPSRGIRNDDPRCCVCVGTLRREPSKLALSN
jgi:hypothetical protein